MDWEESRPNRPYGVPPDPDREWKEYTHWMEEWIGKECRRGDKWYLITKSYFDKLQEYLGDKNKNPGPVEVSGIVDKDGEMLDRVAHEGNFKVIIGQVWVHISEKFGIKDNLPPIPRQVVDHEVFGRDLIERKVLHVFMAHSRDSSRSAWVPWLMSRGDRIFEVEHHLRKCFDLTRTAEMRMWHLWDETSMLWEPLLSKFDRPEDMYNLFETHRSIVFRVEPMNEDGTWPLTLPRDPGLPKKKLGSTLREMWGYPYGTKLEMGHTGDNPHRGIVGLTNVENCCYMNCVIQVLAQIPAIRDYILTDTYIRELNPDNPLSKNGDFAKQFGNLIKHMWSEKWTDLTPETFKRYMAKYNDEYAAYGLHDAHEFLMYLLDGLHEDCNRIKKKPYIELDTDGKSDEVAAKESWDAYKARNESVAIDMFHYLTKSALNCPECKKVSLTFEPQFGLSLPVPYITNNSVPLTFLYLDPAKKPLRLRVLMRTTDQASWEEYKQQVSEITGVPVKRIRPGNMLPHRTWQEFWHNQKGLKDQMNGEFRTQPPLSLEKPEPPKDENHHNFLIEIYQLQADYSEITINWKDGAPFYFHLPFYLPNLRSNDIKYEVLYNMIYDRIKNRLPVPKDNWWEWKSPEDDVEEERVEKSFKSHKQMYKKPNLSNDTNVWEKNGKRYLFRIYNKTRDHYYPNDDKEMRWITYGSIGILFHPKYARDYIVPTFDPDRFVKDMADDHESFHKPAPKDIYTIDECLKEFHATEQLGSNNNWYCSNCKEHRQPTKDMSIWSTPDYLIITLKRFEFNKRNNEHKKIQAMVKFPVEGLDMDPYIKNPAHKKGSAIYDLIGIVNHSGTLSRGHYTNFVKHCEDQYWYFYNDDKACPGYPEFLHTRQAYMLFYKKRGIIDMTFTAPPEGVSEPFTTVRPVAVREQQKIDDRLSSMYGDHPTNKGVFRKANAKKGRPFDEYDPRRRYYDSDDD